MIIVDVGANAGEFTESILLINKHARVFALEPNKPKFESDWHQLTERFGNRLHVDYVALGSSKKSGILLYSNSRDGQLASIVPANLRSTGWANPLLFESVTTPGSLEVAIETPKDFLDRNAIPSVDFLKIDVQGNDVEILDMFLSTTAVQAGVVEVECGLDADDTRYLNAKPNDINSLIQVLNAHQMKIAKVVPNNSSLDELNVFFCREMKTFANISEELGFSSNPALGRFWRVSGINPLAQESLLSLLVTLSTKVFKAFLHPKQSLKAAILKLSK